MRSLVLTTFSLALPFLVQSRAQSQDPELEVLRKIKGGEALTWSDRQAASKMLEIWRKGIADGAEWADNPEMESFLARAANDGAMGAGDRAWANHCIAAYRYNSEVDTDPLTYGVQTEAPVGPAARRNSSSGSVVGSSGDLKAMMFIVGISAATFGVLAVAFMFKRRRAQSAMDRYGRQETSA